MKQATKKKEPIKKELRFAVVREDGSILETFNTQGAANTFAEMYQYNYGLLPTVVDTQEKQNA